MNDTQAPSASDPAGESRCVAGLDIGGTKISWCLGRADGTVLASERAPMGREPAEVVLAIALERLQALAKQHEVEPTALGVSCPGPFRYPEGTFLDVPNMPRWQGFALRSWLEGKSPWPVHAINDANALVAAECLWGAAQGSRVALFLTMSTGMGAGLAVDGRPVHGARGFCGEIGHLRLSDDGPVGFAKRGSVEGYLSGPGMAQVARGEVLRCRQAGLHTVLGDDVDPEGLFAAARSRDPAATAALDIIIARLGQLLALLVDVFDPDVIALGTIAVAHHDLLLPRARELMLKEALAHGAHVKVVPSALADHGNQAALAAGLCGGR